MFENIIGNNKIKNLLENSIKQGNVSHSYLFIGIDGIGKKLIAKELSKYVLCLNNGCNNTCKSCIEFESKIQYILFILLVIHIYYFFLFV